ncbi:FAD-dependent oxidoreductase, partial [Staphylococcus epidermidis]|uniref:FAD-dependent oxidoreductase n=1 Tax=Staphylococcus epidermidis TaxID=1282 RepID=UPI001642B3C7
GVRVRIIEVGDEILLSEMKESREMLKGDLDNEGIKIVRKGKIKEVKEWKIILDGEDDVRFDRVVVGRGREGNREVGKDLNLEM